jgi:hypothetical protein
MLSQTGDAPMSLKTLVLMIAAVQVAAPANFRPSVTIKGTATDCFADSITRVSSVRISAFNAGASREIIESLRVMEALSFEDSLGASIARMNLQFNRVMALSERMTSLSRVRTDAKGVFEMSTTPVDSVLVIASYDDEGEAFPYAYAIVPGRSDQSIELDLSRGSCNYIKERNF